MSPQSQKPLKIAILGTRGIPARYGGFETFAEEIATRLVTRGHSVTVYVRHPFFSSPDKLSDYRGVQLLSCPTIMHKYLETPLHALMSFLDLWRRNYDAVLLCNAANSPFAWLVRLRGMKLYINVDGIERKRSKWNSLGRLWYRLGEYCSVLFANRVVADAQVIADYYREQYRCEAAVIAYGADPVMRPAGKFLAEFGLKAKEYILYVSRLEPENNALGVVQAYVQSGVKLPLVVVGDAPYADRYKERIRAAASPQVIFTGFQFGEAYQELRAHCYLYIQATEVGGTHPALVEAMAYGNAIIANRTPEHEEVLDQAGEYYGFNNFAELAEKLRQLQADPARVNALGKLAADRAQQKYSWKEITDKYEALFQVTLNS